jgi:hypothetical protein
MALTFASVLTFLTVVSALKAATDSNLQFPHLFSRLFTC